MPIITFDFDETLTQPTWSKRYQLFEPSDTPNFDSIAKLKHFHELGKEVKIVTTRWRDEEIVEFVTKHQLPVSSIHCTQGELKATKLKELGSSLHFDRERGRGNLAISNHGVDDNEAEAIANLKLQIPTIIVSFRFDAPKDIPVCLFRKFEPMSR